MNKYEIAVREMERDFREFAREHSETISQDWMFTRWTYHKLASLQMEVDELKKTVTRLDDPHRDYE